MPKISKEKALDVLSKHNIDYKFFSAKASAEFDAMGMSGSGSMQVRIKKNDQIWMLGKKLGIEVFRCLINKDSFFTVNRLEHSYMAEPNAQIEALFGIPMEFQEIQELMAGNVVLPSENDLVEYHQIEPYSKISFNSQLYSHTYFINPYTLTLEKIEMADRQGNLILAIFEDYRKIGKANVSYSRKYFFTSREGEEARIELDASEIELNIEKSLIFDLPLHYDRIRI